MDTTISKVKPPPPKFAKLQFSFYTSDESKFPILSQSMRADANGTFNLEFFLKNISGETGAEKADIWMEICVECRYTEVAAGFQRPAESAEQVRHKSLPHLNQGVYLEPWKVSVSVPEKFTEFHIRFQYACQTCAPGKMPPQQLKVWVIPPFRLSLPKPKKKPS